MRDICGDASRTSLLVLRLVEFELKYDLRVSEGEVDSVLLSGSTASARFEGTSKPYSIVRMSTGGLLALVPYGVLRAEDAGADDFSGIVEAEPTPVLLSSCVFGPAGVLTGTWGLVDWTEVGRFT